MRANDSKLLRRLVSYFLSGLESFEELIYRGLLKVSYSEKLKKIIKKKINYPSILIPKKQVPLSWWYFTGHLRSGKRKFGFEYCIFKFNPRVLRFGFIPLSFLHPKPFLVMNKAIVDKDNGKFMYSQDSGLVSADSIDYSAVNFKINNSFLKMKRSFTIKDDNMNLTLTPVKKILKHYDKGYKLVYDEPPYRTYYVSFSRMDVSGNISVRGKKYNVTGEAWFDHQKSNLPHKSVVRGWDWFSVMLKDKTEFMFFIIRDKNGLSLKARGGSYVKKNSKLVQLYADDVKVKTKGRWKSFATGIVYPSGWDIEIPKLKMNLSIDPYVKNQELDSNFKSINSYWEGACRVRGTKEGRRIKGEGYVELVGYDHRLFSEFILKSIM